MGSRFTGSDSPGNGHSKFKFKMEAIKKKMQAMKVEKDNACDQADVSEEKMKAARIRAQKGEDEVAELELKSRQLETELDITAERLSIATLQLEEKEKQLAATELEMNALTRQSEGRLGEHVKSRSSTWRASSPLLCNNSASTITTSTISTTGWLAASAFLHGLSTASRTCPRRLAVPASFAFSRLTCWILV